MCYVLQLAVSSICAPSHCQLPSAPFVSCATSAFCSAYRFRYRKSSNDDAVALCAETKLVRIEVEDAMYVEDSYLDIKLFHFQRGLFILPSIPDSLDLSIGAFDLLGTIAQ